MKKNNFLILLLLIFNLGCGTDTGNPGLAQHLPLPGSASSLVTDSIASSMCTKIRSCFTPTLASCETKIRTATNVPTALGLSETTYPNFDTIQLAVNNQTLRIDSIKAAACLNALNNISCSDTSIQQSYNSADLENLTQAWKLLSIDTNCSQFIY